MPDRKGQYVLFSVRGGCYLPPDLEPSQIARHLEQILRTNNYVVRGGHVEPTAVDWLTDSEKPIEVLAEFDASDQSALRDPKPKPKKPVLPAPPPIVMLPPPPAIGVQA